MFLNFIKQNHHQFHFFFVLIASGIFFIVIPKVDAACTNCFYDITFENALCPQVVQDSDGPGNFTGIWTDQTICQAGDGISKWTDSTYPVGDNFWAECPNGDSIKTAWNYPGGLGGKGLFHCMANGGQKMGGGINIGFTTPVKHVWMRWYMKYTSGFTWVNNMPLFDKLVYWYARNIGGPSSPAAIPDFTQGNNYTIYFNQGVGNYQAANQGWTTIMGGSTGDGIWHCYETEFQMDTNGADGIVRSWIDGIAKHNGTNVNLGTWTDGFTNAVIGSNLNAVNNSPTGPEMWGAMYDDIAFSTNGRIGCLGGSYSYSQSSYYNYSQSSYAPYSYSQSSYVSYSYSQASYYAYGQSSYTGYSYTQSSYYSQSSYIGYSYSQSNYYSYSQSAYPPYSYVQSSYYSPGPQAGIPPGVNLDITMIVPFFASVGGFLMILGGIIAGIVIIASGIRYLMAGANPQGVASAKNMLKVGIIGALIIFGVGLIVNTVRYFAENPFGFF